MNPKTILIVDDEQSIRQLLRRIFSREGFLILEASNGKEALDVFKRETGKIQLVLMDMSMPQMDGQTCARLMLKERPQIPMVYMSGDMDAARMPAELNKPGTAFLSKPFSNEEMLLTAREVLMKTSPD